MGREAHIKNSSDGGRLPAGHGIGGIKARIMELRLPLCGPAEQPLDAVLRRCNTFHFISFLSTARTCRTTSICILMRSLRM